MPQYAEPTPQRESPVFETRITQLCNLRDTRTALMNQLEAACSRLKAIEQQPVPPRVSDSEITFDDKLESEIRTIDLHNEWLGGLVRHLESIV